MSWVTTWGSTVEERALAYPCDRQVAGADATLFRAVDVNAPAPLVYRWLCQLRVAPYSYDLLDNFGRRSPRTRDPANEALAVGARMMRIFRLVELEPDRHLTMVIDRTRSFGEVAVTYQVTPAGNGERCRIVAKLCVRYGGRSLMRLVLPLGDLIMMRKQLLTLKQLAEREHRQSLA